MSLNQSHCAWSQLLLAIQGSPASSTFIHQKLSVAKVLTTAPFVCFRNFQYQTALAAVVLRDTQIEALMSSQSLNLQNQISELQRQLHLLQHGSNLLQRLTFILLTLASALVRYLITLVLLLVNICDTLFAYMVGTNFSSSPQLSKLFTDFSVTCLIIHHIESNLARFICH